MDRIKEKERNGLLLWLLITAVLAALSVFFVIFALAIPLVLAYMMARFNVAGGIAGVVALGAAALFSPDFALTFAVAFLPMSVAAAVTLRKKRRFRDSVVIISFAALAGAALCFGLLWLIKGISPVEYVVQRASGLFGMLGDDQVSLIYQGARYTDIQTGAITQQAVLATPRAKAIGIMLDILRETVGYSLVPLMIVYALLWGLLCYLVPHRYASRHGALVKTIPAFSDYELPRRLWAAFLISFLGAVAGEALGLPRFDLLKDVILIAYAFVFIVQALSFLDFLYKQRGIRFGLRMVFHIAAVIILGYMLMWVGIFENIIRFRRRSQEKGGEEF